MNKNNLIEYLSYHYDKYSDADQVICKFFISNKSLNNLTIKHVANECNVSMASVTRFAKKSGFSGFKEFSVYYQKSLGDILNVTELSAENVMKTMHLNFIEKLYTHFEQYDFSTISQQLKLSPNLFIFGFGKTDLLSRIFSMKLDEFDFRIFHSQYYEHFNYSIQKKATKADFILVLYHHAVYEKELAELIRLAKQKGSRILVLSLANTIDEQNYANSVVLFPDWHNNVSKNTTTMYMPFLAFIDTINYHLLN